jgi:hypothetical protein
MGPEALCVAREHAPRSAIPGPEPPRPMKLLLEVLVAVFLHPIAFILMLINLVGRTDLGDLRKIVWAVVGLVWGIGPILYLLVGDGAFW